MGPPEIMLHTQNLYRVLHIHKHLAPKARDANIKKMGGGGLD